MFYKKLSLIGVVLFFAVAVVCAEPAYKFSLEQVNKASFSTEDKKVNLADYKGKVVFIDFFATWCPPCKASIPAVEAFDGKNKNKRVVLGVTTGESSETVTSFIEDKGITYPVLMIDNTTNDAYALTSIPTFYIIDQKGNIAKKYKGYAEGMEKLWQKDIDALISKK